MTPSEHLAEILRRPAAVAFMLGDTSPEVLDELRLRMLRWADQRDDAQPLNRMLALGTTRATRLALRDALLVEASTLLAGTRWARCTQLAKLGGEFNDRRYRSWKRLGIPSTATAAERLIYRAADLGEPLPESPEHLPTHFAGARVVNARITWQLPQPRSF
jgi:hypothetical protein